MKPKDIKNSVLKLTDGLLENVTDLVLFNIYLVLTSTGKQPTAYGWDKAFSEAHNLLHGFNYQSIKKILTQLKYTGHISYQKGQIDKTLTLTSNGYVRLKELIPSFDMRQKWNGKLYLITYDVPEVNRKHRNIIRAYIKKWKGALLQESIWLTPYNPRSILKQIIFEKQLKGVVIVSDLGKDAVIGEENIKDLIWRIYHLEEINQRYEKFIRLYRGTRNLNLWEASKYLSILKDDPQLPYKLLLDKWVGDKACNIYKKSKSVTL